MAVNVLSSLQMTAEAMARKMGIKVIVHGETAYTNGKDIVIPILPDTDEAMILARGYIDHEAAHIAITDFSVRKTNWNNIIEDVRIEVERSKIYPGIRKNIQDLIDVLVSKGEYLNWDKNHPKALLAAWVSMRARVNAGNVNLRDKAEAAEKAAITAFGKEFCGKIMDIISRIPLCKTTQDSDNLGKEIEKLIQDSQKDQGSQGSQKGKGSQRGKDKSDQSDSDSGKDSDSGNDADSEKGSGDTEKGSDSDSDSDLEASSSSGSGAGSSDSESDSDTGNDSGSGEDSDSDSGSKSDSDSGKTHKKEKPNKLKELLNSDEPDNADLGQYIAETMDKASEAHLEKGKLTLSDLSCPGTSPAPRLTEIIDIPPLGGLVAQIKGLLQAQKVRYHAETVSGHRLSRYATSKIACQTPDTRLFAKRELRKDMNTAVAILLDRSSSMEDHGAISIACAGSYIAAHAMDMNNIPCMVGTFPSFHILKDFTKHATKNMEIDPLGSTPLAEALIWVSGLLLPRKEQRKIVIVVTDGEPDSPSLAKEAIELMKTKYDIEVYAIGIGRVAEQALGTWFTDTKRQRKIRSANEFPKALLEVLRDGLTKRQIQ